MLSLPNRVTVMDVSPRDGLQSEPVFVPTEKKVQLIEAIISAGVRKIEATSFVSPKWVPQMADAGAVLRAVVSKHPDVTFEVLLPNEKGYDRARATGLVKEIGFVVAATETLNVKNVNLSVADSMKQFGAIAGRAKADGLHVRGTIGVAFVCPYEGRVARERVVRLADEYFDFGADEVCIADTIGRATPNNVYDVAAAIKDRHPDQPLAGHFHDTHGHALANIFAAMQAGADVFDSAVGNLGGCQFAKGATGNVSTERVAFMLSEMGIETGIDYDRIVEAGRMARGLIASKFALVVLLVSVVSAQPPVAWQGQAASEPRPIATRKRLVKPKPLTAKSHREAEQRLADLGYWTGPIDGRWDEASRHALIAFRKVEGLKRSGRLTRLDFDVLMSARKPVPLETGQAHIEVDLTRQVLFVVEGGGVITHILPVSTGSGKEFISEGWARDAITHPGRYKTYIKIPGWKKSPLGRLYYPVYFMVGTAIHGYPSVPVKPASHGCIRIPMFAAKEFYEMTPMDMPVIVHQQQSKTKRTGRQCAANALANQNVAPSSTSRI